MAEETAVISTPESTSSADTSQTVETDVQTSDTSTVETAPNDTPAEIQKTDTNTSSNTQPQEKLYANKYKSVEELEKGYTEAQKLISKSSDFEKKYNELLSKQAQEQEQLQAQRLRQAREQGFSNVESAEIANAVTLAEFNLYANGIKEVNPEDYETVREQLISYYNTGNKGYLEEAKRYFSSGFIEKVALQKQRMTDNLKAQYSKKQQQQKDETTKRLAETLRQDYNEFLADVNDNQGKAEALKAFCGAGFINSKEDMAQFKGIYDKIAQIERAKAIKEYEAQKAIEAAKQGSQIEGGTGAVINSNGMPTAEQIDRMSQDEYNKAYEKYGAKLLQQYMKK